MSGRSTCLNASGRRSPTLAVVRVMGRLGYAELRDALGEPSSRLAITATTMSAKKSSPPITVSVIVITSITSVHRQRPFDTVRTSPMGRTFRHPGKIYQMRCPEQRAWGGVLKRYGVPLYGSKGTALYRARRSLVWLFTYYSKARFWVAAREVAKDIQDYVRSGLDVVGIIGIGGSPSCGVCRTLDLHRSVEVLGACPISRLDRDAFNEKVIAANLVAGEGLFIASIRRQLKRRNYRRALL